MIEILDIRMDYTRGDVVVGQTAFFVIDNAGTNYLYSRGGLPSAATKAEIQSLLESEESRLSAQAAAKGIVFDVFEGVVERRILKALALVVLDEINILRQAAGLPARNESQIREAIKNKLTR